MPDFSMEDEYDGLACGLDEVGRGPLAGPVVAACVYIAPERRDLPFVTEIRDSKKLSRAKLDLLYEQICGHFSFGVAACSPGEIDDLNILWASMRAMERAYEAMPAPLPYALVDGNRLPRALPCAARAVVKGDGLSVSIAAASIVAKVTRDRMMEALAKEHPCYGWERNVGYPTREHLEAIQNYGVTEYHRKSFGPVRKFLEAA